MRHTLLLVGSVGQVNTLRRLSQGIAYYIDEGLTYRSKIW